MQTRPKKNAPKKRLASRKVKVSVDPSRLALSALERIKSILVRIGHPERFGAPTTMRELAARASFAGRPLPPSYVAAMRETSIIGDPEELLSAADMERVSRELIGARPGTDRTRYIPFAGLRSAGVYYCFDQRVSASGDDAELAVVEWQSGVVKAVASHFGEWVDLVADDREGMIEQAAEIPKGLRDLLVQLGFRFEDPIVGRLVTGDVEAILTLVGDARAEQIRGEANRLFDSTGKAQLALNLDEFALTCSVRTGTLVFEAEDVFRWLRTFRDENFFGESYREPSHPDSVRDLRKAPREPPLVIRGVLEVSALPARRHFFCDASGTSPQSYYLLGRGMGSDRTTSLILHVVRGEIRTAHNFGQPLHSIYAAEDGALWGLSSHGSVVRFTQGTTRTFALPRSAGSLTWWYGIGEHRGKIIVWGTGALLELDTDGQAFVPFRPDAKLEKHEAVVALDTRAVRAGRSAIGAGKKTELSMLVCGEHVGAVARFDGREWLPIDEAHVVEADLADYDVWRGVGILLGRGGEVWRVEGGIPRSVLWDNGENAFVDDTGQPRAVHGVRGFDGGALLASDGGVIVVGGNEPVFHAARGASEPARLARIGSEGASANASGGGSQGGSNGAGADGTAEPNVGILITFGPHVWNWSGGALHVLDMRAW